MDIVRVLRIIEYSGPRDVVERQIERSLHGTKEFGNPPCRITAATLGTYPEILQQSEQKDE